MTQATQEKWATGQILSANTIHEKDLPTLLHIYRIPSSTTTLMLLDTQPRHVIAPEERQNLLRFVLFDSNFDFAPYTTGHIFHDLGELRWERQKSKVQLVYTGHREYKPEQQDAREVTLDHTYLKENTYLLFGKRLKKTLSENSNPMAQEADFAEVRIPRLLRYPALPALENADNLQLVMCKYIHPQTAQTVAYRYKSLESSRKQAR